MFQSSCFGILLRFLALVKDPGRLAEFWGILHPDEILGENLWLGKGRRASFGCIKDCLGFFWDVRLIRQQGSRRLPPTSTPTFNPQHCQWDFLCFFSDSTTFSADSLEILQRFFWFYGCNSVARGFSIGWLLVFSLLTLFPRSFFSFFLFHSSYCCFYFLLHYYFLLYLESPLCVSVRACVYVCVCVCVCVYVCVVLEQSSVVCLFHFLFECAAIIAATFCCRARRYWVTSLERSSWPYTTLSI